MKGKGGIHLSYAGRDTIFNVLLHFSSEVLTEKNFEPVCHYEHLLRWHDLSSYISEDLLTTSYLAARDVYYRRSRCTFCWQPVIGHDNRPLNELFKRPMMDLHFHLNGSSLNFEVNWMSLMNRISGWSKTFKKLKKPQQEIILLTDDGNNNEPFYLCAIKAAILRALLFEYVEGNKTVLSIPLCDIDLSNKILNANTVEEVIPYVKELDVITQRLRYNYGKKYSSEDGSFRVPDYAILDRHTNNKYGVGYVLSVLSGERWIMYELFYDIYSHTNIDKRIVVWFYAYLLYKARFRSELVQTNTTIGFANFATYEKRKNLFIRTGSVYDSLLSQLAVVSFLSPSKERWLEVRITPKNSRRELEKHIRKTISYIADRHFMTKETLSAMKDKYGLVLHFIKEADNDNKPSKISLGHCRHYDIRYKIKKQAHAIMALRQSLISERDAILGIDAANSEVFARPEVFAQAFRYLRESTDEVAQGSKILTDLGMTYHVGEDYLDVVDGLRAIDELMQFMNFRDGDRIGHGMVLGIGVKEYYSHAHNNVILPSQLLVDNVAWLYFKGKNLPEFTPASKALETLFETYCQKIYGHINLNITMWNYYQSWLLRGDNPHYYFHKNRIGKHIINSRWSMFNLNDNPEVRKAAENHIACELYEAYQFDPDVRMKGKETVLEKLSNEVVEYIVAVQKQMLNEIEQRHISIECNPTSNLKIGHFNSYSTHPILRMNNDKLPIDEDPHSISVTINTDDKGIFSTSLEREFSLLALSLEKKYVKTGICSPRVIYDWLDRIRQMSEEQRF